MCNTLINMSTSWWVYILKSLVNIVLSDSFSPLHFHRHSEYWFNHWHTHPSLQCTTRYHWSIQECAEKLCHTLPHHPVFKNNQVKFNHRYSKTFSIFVLCMADLNLFYHLVLFFSWGLKIFDISLKGCYPTSTRGLQCQCEEQFAWSCDKCTTYGACNDTTQTCGCINALPSDQFCEPITSKNSFVAVPVQVMQKGNKYITTVPAWLSYMHWHQHVVFNYLFSIKSCLKWSGADYNWG